MYEIGRACKTTTVQLFKNYSGKDNEIKKICEIYVMYI